VFKHSLTCEKSYFITRLVLPEFEKSPLNKLRSSGKNSFKTTDPVLKD